MLRELGAMISREFTFAAKLVTVQAVDLTADFKHCHVHVGVLGTPKEQRAAIGKLQESRPHLQYELSKRVVLKFTPQLHFHLDESVERGTKVMEIMRQIDEFTPPGEDADEEAAPTPQTARAAQSAQAMAAEDEQAANDDEKTSADDADETGADADDMDEAEELEEEETQKDLKTDTKHARDAKISKGIKGHSGKHAEASPEDE